MADNPLAFGVRGDGRKVNSRTTKSRVFASPRTGFTLLEMLVALVVISVATSIFLNLYFASISLSKISQAQVAAAEVAQEHLAELLNDPDRFVWPEYDSDMAGTLFVLPLVGAKPEEINQAQPPTALPTERRANNRDSNFYYNFTWEASGRLPEAGANYFEVLIEVTWLEDNIPHYISLSSCIPVSAVGGYA